MREVLTDCGGGFGDEDLILSFGIFVDLDGTAKHTPKRSMAIRASSLQLTAPAPGTDCIDPWSRSKRHPSSLALTSRPLAWRHRLIFSKVTLSPLPNLPPVCS